LELFSFCTLNERASDLFVAIDVSNFPVGGSGGYRRARLDILCGRSVLSGACSVVLCAGLLLLLLLLVLVSSVMTPVVASLHAFYKPGAVSCIAAD